MTAPLRLGLNIDHVATVRNARGGGLPDPVRAAREACAAGVDGITAHLREDRRHIRDDDIARLMAAIDKPLNLEMAVTAAMIDIALAAKPHAACLVPEKRQERTTEGGLDIMTRPIEMAAAIARLSEAGIRVSLFIEPSIAVVEQAARLKAPVIELHTGTWCHAVEKGDVAGAQAEFERLRGAAGRAAACGLECHAGHGLDYGTARQIASLPEIRELNIGHFIIGEAISVGLAKAIADMRRAMEAGRAGSP